MKDCREKTDLKNLSPPDLESFIASFGKERYRSIQILRWLYQKSVHSLDEMTNLSKKFREKLNLVSRISTLQPIRIEVAGDGTKKFLIELEDGNRIESVLIPDKSRLTLCVSTQVGCGLGCRFCLTGKMGWKRDLSVSEIVNQILAVRETLGGKRSITNIVLMGMGEPLANYSNTLKAIELMAHPDGFRFSSRRITLSTAGLLPGLEQLLKEKVQFRLAISLNASDEETRSHLMPVNRRYPMKRVLEVLRNFPLKRRARITFEYVMVEGVNDSPQDAKRLIKLLKGIPSKINLIPLNETPEIPFKRPSEERVRQFQEILMKADLTAIVRTSKGADISAACGQLQG
ncbi:MAG: 23S rRNA (adenine(2503)-C(2))-methyltransferase [Deltaproteobacteria bacterium RBG_16_49_23]|nr:MAG: 23S rRNA (adenine(2503)-C(2))-methyltransferase [Deltaproteobacteria bacterium RBG_16_49_23]